VVGQGLAQFLGAGVFAGGVGRAATGGVEAVGLFVGAHDRELDVVDPRQLVECRACADEEASRYSV